MIPDRDAALDIIDNADIPGRLIFLGEIGSTSHGTHSEPLDDYDLMGIVIPEPRILIGLDKWEHWVKPPGDDGIDIVLYSLEKYIRLSMKANPNVLGLMWLNKEHWVTYEAEWTDILEKKTCFSSKRAHASFTGYAHSQLLRLERGAYKGYMGAKRKALVDKFGMDPKNASHLIRLLRMGIEFLETGQLNVWREDREELKAIKRGEWTLEEVQEEADKLFARANEARLKSKLPDEPNFDCIQSLLMGLHLYELNDHHYLIQS